VLDPAHADAHGWLGVIAWLYDWDWAAAEREFQRALTLNPRALLPLLWYAVILSVRGRHAESLSLLDRAEALDPGSLIVQLVVGRCYWWAGRYDDAIERLRAMLEMDPDHLLAHVWLARALAGKGLLDEAAAVLDEATKRSGRLPILLAVSGSIYGRLGRCNQALSMLAELRKEAQRHYVPATYEAMVLAGVGDADAAFHCLDLAYEQRSGYLSFLGAGPEWGSLQGDPRLAALVKRVGLLPELPSARSRD